MQATDEMIKAGERELMMCCLDGTMVQRRHCEAVERIYLAMRSLEPTPLTQPRSRGPMRR